MSEPTRRESILIAAAALAVRPAAAADDNPPVHQHSAAPPDPHRWTGYQPQFFSPEEFAMLESFTEILIPSDETPGAREAHVAQYIDFMVNAAAEYAPEIQREWRDVMNWLNDERFGALDAPARLAFVTRVSKAEHRHFRTIKRGAVYAFYTSREGLIDSLNYQGNAYLTEFPACTHKEHGA